VLDPAFEEGGDRYAGRFNGGAGLKLGNQAGFLDLRLALGALEGIPALLASAAGRIGHVDDDGPVAG
jgi:hypothetical protein